MNRTALGKVAAKLSGLTLSLSSVYVPVAHSSVVVIGSDNAQGPPDTVKHGGASLSRRVLRDSAVHGLVLSFWAKSEYSHDLTDDIVATWSSAIGKRVMFALSLDSPIREDRSATRIDASTTQPVSGQTGLLAGTTGRAICAFCAEGPDDHSSATADIEDGDVYQDVPTGQHDGTSGGAADSNVSIVESGLQLTTNNTTRGRLVNATDRNWVSGILVVKPIPTFLDQGITPTDISAVAQIVEDAGGETNNIYYGFNESTGLWEAYETTTPGTLRATRDENGAWS